MPASYTHYLIAREAYKAISPAVKTTLQPHLSLYFFGAQGADFCFFYRFLNPKSKNLGSYLHRQGGYKAFCVLKALSARDPAFFSYTLGYITHYAADTLFHPYVYAKAGRSPLRHSRIEGALDAHFRRSIRPKNDSFFRKKLSKEEENQLFFAYAAIAVKTGFPALQKPSFSRAITLFNSYPPISSALFEEKNTRLIHDAVNKKKQRWAYPAAPDYVRYDSGDELFEKSVLFSNLLFGELISSIRQNTKLPFRLFGKNYLTGI